MMVGALRFMWSGWIERLYGEPVFFFKYYGFEWVRVFDVPGMYLLYGLIAVSAGLVMLGLFYRVAIVIFFLSFTYAELADLTNYLNHYYLVCLLAFLMVFLPAHRRFSLDAWRKPKWQLAHVPVWTINVLILQLSIVYFFAGYAKLNTDWLFRAMPLAVWLPSKADLPLIGSLFTISWMPFAFSWAGAFYDLTIPFWLMNRRTRPFAYAAVVVFHVLTRVLFNIGLFPFIMIFNTLIFFPAGFHERLLGWIGYKPGRSVDPKSRVVGERGKGSSRVSRQKIKALYQPVRMYMGLPWIFPKRSTGDAALDSEHNTEGRRQADGSRRNSWFGLRLLPGTINLKNHFLALLLGAYFLLQLLLPFRYLLYPGNVLWTEEGYRFAWRVMLVEKAGQATFTVTDPETGRQTEVINADYLTLFQEKQMAIQPDFILQFAHFLADEYRERYGMEHPVVTVDSHVALNGRVSRRLIDPEVNLAKCRDGFAPKSWVLRYE